MQLRSILLAAVFIIGAGFPAIAESDRAVLTEWDNDHYHPTDADDRHYNGSVAWRTELIKSTDGKDDMSIRADVDIPGRDLKMTMSVRRNFDPSLKASLIVEWTFASPPDLAANAALFSMKESEAPKPIPEVLTGSFFKTKVTGSYVQALSDCKSLALLRDEPWFDIYFFAHGLPPSGYLLFEKGQAGQEVFDAAFAAWEQGAGPAAKSPICPRADASPANPLS